MTASPIDCRSAKFSCAAPSAGSPCDLNLIRPASSFVEPQMENCVVKLSRASGASSFRHLGYEGPHGCRRAASDGPEMVIVAIPKRAVDSNFDSRVGDGTVIGKRAVQWRELDAALSAFRADFAANSLALVGTVVFKFGCLARPRRRGATRRSLAFYAFLDRAEHVGEIAAHLSLVGNARKAARSGQHGKQWHFGQRDVTTIRRRRAMM